MIFRDDDISWKTDLKKFVEVNNTFIEYNVKHTIAVIAKDLEKMPKDLVTYIRDSGNIQVQLHCLDHFELPNCSKEELLNDLGIALDEIEGILQQRPTILFPPWNKTSPMVNMVAHRLGLTVSWEKVSFSQYIKTRGYVLEQVVNFHYWAYEETQFLETALRIYNENMGRV